MYLPNRCQDRLELQKVTLQQDGIEQRECKATVNRAHIKVIHSPLVLFKNLCFQTKLQTYKANEDTEELDNICVGYTVETSKQRVKHCYAC